MSRIAVCAGSFDPVTLGHEDIIRRGARIFDELYVGIGINPEKHPLFTPEERRGLMATIFADQPNIHVECFTGLTVDYAHSKRATIMMRGVRTVSDIESEFTLALANSTLAPDLETVFLMAAEQYSHISSSLIKQIASMGRDRSLAQLRKFIPEPVIAPLLSKVSQP